ncbi:Eco29kI family restriction endonuclease [Phytoactinopolyspora halophila]|uniref:Eco29kI family restriction endonuclease n=1 Tax=Phytoactinopolyspora halophila TaxID=1981511 RepID=UPI001314974C|nr:Eco29kI family restriction endonuclease [Phytoactinopolyspora halophila]
MTEDHVSKASAEFKLSITRALADQLLEKLANLDPVPLTSDNLEALQPRPGIYELFLNGGDGSKERVYVGKASKELPSRLDKHRRKLSGRAHINLTDVHFQCLYVDEDLEAAAPEKMLINRYRAAGVVPWNTNGFGNNDPGRKRDHSLVKAKHFDALYPANLDLILDGATLPPGEYTIKRYLKAVKTALPFNLRYEERTASAKDYTQHKVEVPEEPLTARELIALAIDALPEGWQATALPGYVILYYESDDYESARYLWRKQDGRAHELAGKNLRDEDGEVEEEESNDE